MQKSLAKQIAAGLLSAVVLALAALPAQADGLPHFSALGFIGLDSSSELTRQRSVRDGENLGGWVYGADNLVCPFPGDFDGDGRADVIVESGWGLGIIGTDFWGSMKTIVAAQFGPSYGGWRLGPADVVRGAGRLVDERDAFVITSGWGIGILQVSGSTLSVVQGAPWATLVPADSAGVTPWTLAASDRIVAVRDFTGDGRADLLLRGSGGLGIVSLDSANRFVTSQNIPWGTVLPGGWMINPADRFAGFGDTDNNNADDIVVQSGWGIGVIGAKGAMIKTLGLKQYGSSIGSWNLRAGDTIEGVQDFDGDHYADWLIRGEDGIAVLAFTSLGFTYTMGTIVEPVKKWLAGWRLGPADRFDAYGDFDGDSKIDFTISSPWGFGIVRVGDDMKFQLITANTWREYPFAQDDIVTAGRYSTGTKSEVLMQTKMDRVLAFSWPPGNLQSRVEALGLSYVPSYLSYASLGEYQTSVKNQSPLGGSGGCTVFALVGAIEALYKRKLGLTLDLSEQYQREVARQIEFVSSGFIYPPDAYPLPLDTVAPWCVDVQTFTKINFPRGVSYLPNYLWTALMPNYGQRCVEGTWDQKFFAAWGNAGLDAYLKDQDQWKPDGPYVPHMSADSVVFSQAWLPTVAKTSGRYAATAKVPLPMNDPWLIEQVILNNREVVYQGNYPGVGGHAFIIYGFDHKRSVFFVKNSWGSDPSLDVMPYATVTSTGDPDSYFLRDVVNPEAGPTAASVLMGMWRAVRDDGTDAGLLVFQRGHPTTGREHLGHFYTWTGDWSERAPSGKIYGYTGLSDTIFQVDTGLPGEWALHVNPLVPDTIIATAYDDSGKHLRLSRANPVPAFPATSLPLPPCSGETAMIITSARPSGDSCPGCFSMSFNTTPGAIYRMERTTSLGPNAQWLPVPGAEQLQGTGQPMNVIDRTAGQFPRGFYRLARW